MATIVCDSDFLIKISNDPLPKFYFQELVKENDFIVIPSVLGEIKGLEKSRVLSTARRARLARRVVEETKVFERWYEDGQIGSKKEDTDITLIEFVSEKPRERVLATMDGSLLSRLEKMGLPYLTLRNGKALFSKKWG